MGYLRAARFVLPITAAAAALGCGSEPEPAVQEPVARPQAAQAPAAETAGNHAPVIERIRFEPEVPVPVG